MFLSSYYYAFIKSYWKQNIPGSHGCVLHIPSSLMLSPGQTVLNPFPQTLLSLRIPPLQEALHSPIGDHSPQPKSAAA